MEEHLKRATEAPDFVVDDDHGALLNTNIKGLQAYRQQRLAALKNLGMLARVERLENSIEEIKELLIKALTK